MENKINEIKRFNDKQLKEYAQELREKIIKTTLQNGGHLASNLGVVELTVALYYVFNTPADKLVWDVGHQTYAHKIITGRNLDTIRTMNGLSGFPDPSESEYDVFTAGHSSTSISTALGLARARDLNKEHHQVAAIIGDGAMGGGMALEALNDLGFRQSKVIVVLNDNEMSISRNVGALSRHLTRLRTSKAYENIKKGLKKLLNKVPGIGNPILIYLERIKNTIRYFLMGKTLFDNFGIKYLGPVNGHDISELIHVLKRAQREEQSVLVHVMTQKGKGFASAENDPERFHGLAPYQVYKQHSTNTYSNAFGNFLTQLAQTETKICAITAGMTNNTGLNNFSKCFPDRFFDVGIAEQHAVAMAAGLAKGGYKPFVVIYSTFLQRSFDQIFHDVMLQNLPVVFCVDRSGLTGEDGETHQGIYDIGFLRGMADFTVMAPRDYNQLYKMARLSMQMETPVVIRYPRGACEGTYVCTDVLPGKWDCLKEGEDIVILSSGSMLKEAFIAAELLEQQGISTKIIDAKFIKPIDESLLLGIKDYKHICILEDNVKAGGLGEAVISFLSSCGAAARLQSIALPDERIIHATISQQRTYYGIDGRSAADKILILYNQNIKKA